MAPALKDEAKVRGGDAAPGAFGFRDENGADDVLVEFDGEDGVELVRVAELHHVELHGVGERDMAVAEVLAGCAEGGQGADAGALVLGVELAGEGLGGGYAEIGGGVLDSAEPAADRRDGAAGDGAGRGADASMGGRA